MIIDSDLISLKMDVTDQKEIINLLGGRLKDKGIVKNSFCQAVIDREEINPTGLKGKHINFAIPHTDSDHVNETAIAVATLNNPVEFNSMEDPDEKLEVSLIIMFAVKDPDKHIKVLQNLIEFIQNKEMTDKIINSSDPEKVKNIISGQIL